MRPLSARSHFGSVQSPQVRLHRRPAGPQSVPSSQFSTTGRSCSTTGNLASNQVERASTANPAQQGAISSLVDTNADIISQDAEAHPDDHSQLAQASAHATATRCSVSAASAWERESCGYATTPYVHTTEQVQEVSLQGSMHGTVYAHITEQLEDFGENVPGNSSTRPPRSGGNQTVSEVSNSSNNAVASSNGISSRATQVRHNRSQGLVEGLVTRTGTLDAEHNPSSQNISATQGVLVAPVLLTAGASTSGRMFERLQESQGRSALARLHDVSAIVNRIPAGDDITCCICLEVMKPSTQKIVALFCGHRYHAICVNTWLQTRKICQCPLCQTTF